MKIFTDKKVCRKCKDERGPFIKIGKTKWKQAYFCRKCNTEKSRLYRETENGKKAIRLAVMRSYYRHHEKSLARGKIGYAVASGKIKRPNKCSGCKKKLFTEAHHPDYSKPLNVLWLCKNCHCEVEKSK